MGNDAESVVCRFYELALAGDMSGWELWADDATSVPPPEFPESHETQGVVEIRRMFASWASVFGKNWFDGLRLAAATELPDGRVLADVSFDLTGERSGAPFHKDAAVIYTVREGRIVRAEHFMDRTAAQEAAGL